MWLLIAAREQARGLLFAPGEVSALFEGLVSIEVLYRRAGRFLMVVKRGHMVSKGYIKAWADGRNLVDVIDIQDRRGFLSSIKNATVVTHVYDPNVLARNLEEDYSRIENAGIPVIVKLCEGAQFLTVEERSAMIAFLGMHLHRGRYADRTKLRVPAALFKTGGELDGVELAVGDMLLLSQALPEPLRLSVLSLEQWEWKVLEAEGLATGDGAVLLWRPTKDAGVCTVSFPLSPTRLLVIGQDLPDELLLNLRVAANSKRWIVGQRGTLNLAWASSPKM